MIIMMCITGMSLFALVMVMIFAHYQGLADLEKYEQELSRRVAQMEYYDHIRNEPGRLK